MSMLAEKCRAIIIIGQNDVKCHPKCWNCLENNRDNLFGLVMGHSQCDMRIVQFYESIKEISSTVVLSHLFFHETNLY